MKVRVLGAAALLALLVASVPASAPSPLQGGFVAIIVNPQNPIEEINLKDLRKYFMGERGEWPNMRSTPVIACMLPPSSQGERNVVLNSVYPGWGEGFYKKHFLQARFAANEAPPQKPQEMRSASHMIYYVSRTPGALGYMRVEQGDCGVRSVEGLNVKVLRVNFRCPGQSGYPIR